LKQQLDAGLATTKRRGKECCPAVAVSGVVTPTRRQQHLQCARLPRTCGKVNRSRTMGCILQVEACAPAHKQAETVNVPEKRRTHERRRTSLIGVDHAVDASARVYEGGGESLVSCRCGGSESRRRERAEVALLIFRVLLAPTAPIAVSIPACSIPAFSNSACSTLSRVRTANCLPRRLFGRAPWPICAASVQPRGVVLKHGLAVEEAEAQCESRAALLA
jgi:hypothetical protein